MNGTLAAQEAAVGLEPSEYVLLLVDSHPTMQVWSAGIERIVSDLETLGRVEVQRVALGAGRVPELTGRVRLVLLASDGASPAWRSTASTRLLRALGQNRPTVVLHLLSQPRWYRTGIDPDPVRLQMPPGGAPNSQWLSETAGFGLPPGADVMPVPVLTADTAVAWATEMLAGPPAWTTAAALLVPSSDGGPGPEGESPRPVADPRASVNEFRAAVPALTFRLATYLAALPLNLALVQDLRAPLLPESTLEDLTEVLLGPLVRLEDQPSPGARGTRLRFDSAIRQELLASARRSDIERVVRVVRESAVDAPGVSSFTTLLDLPAVPPGGEPGDTREETQWRQARALVRRALSGPYYHQGIRELERLGAEDTSSRGSPTRVTSTRREAMDAKTRSAGGRMVLGDYPLRNPNFTGRGELLSDLYSSLRSEAQARDDPSRFGVTAVLPHALHGMGGVGKSLLAIEYIYRHASEYDVVWWIAAERPTGIQASLITLGERLGLGVPQEVNTAVPVVLDALRRGEPYGNWLLVFDNAESPEQVMPYLPKDGPGHILITSRDARWSQVARPLEVNVFTRQESINLLQKRKTGISDEDADQLAEALGDLPLAIEQAAAWHAETMMPAQEYLRLLDEKQVELLDQPAPIDYQIPVIAAWNVSLDQLETRSPAALHLLQVCAFFAPEPVPRALLTKARGREVLPQLDETFRDPIRFSRALREISRYSLARIDHRTNSIQMHRLVQAALIARMPEDQRTEYRHAAHRILAANDPAEPENPAEYGTYGSLYPHILASKAVECDEKWIRDLIINEAKYLHRWGDHVAAVELARNAYNIWLSKYGDSDPQTLEMALWLGFTLFSVGRYEEAAALNATLLAVYERKTAEGEADPDGELLALANVAIDRRAQGEFAEALAISERVFEGSLRSYGPDFPETLNAAHNLAVSQRLSGLFAAARDRDQETLDLKLEVFGPDHLLTLITRLGLLVDLRELGDYTKAEQLHEFELSRAVSALGDLNPVTLLARRLLSVAQRKSGHHETAYETSEVVRRQLRDRFGPQHPDALAAESNYAIDLRQVGRLEVAASIGEDVVKRYSGRLGAEHPHTLSAQVNLAITYRLLGNPQRALQGNIGAHAGLARRLGPDHPSVLVAATNLGSDYHALGDHVQALAHDEDSWRRLSAVFGAQHPTTLACEANLAIDLRRLGRRAEADEHHEHAASTLRAMLGAGHPAVREVESSEERANCDLDPMPL